MREVGAYEAKTRLPELLRCVEKGETTAAIIDRMKRKRLQRQRLSKDEILQL